jgi:NAD(P)-dependent dehydrogenase (short-subunit alcohol dehydrogenase family)
MDADRLTRILNAEVAAEGIRVNAVCLAFIYIEIHTISTPYRNRLTKRV